MFEHYYWGDIIEQFCALLLSVLICMRSIPMVNAIARAKGLLNDVGERTSHRYKTPNLGGVSIFLAITIVSLFFIDGRDMPGYRYVYLSALIVFFTGLKDDLVLIAPVTKLLLQLTAAFVLAYGGLLITSAHGVFSTSVFSPIGAFLITVLFIVAVINAMNLIDGIDGLASTITVLIMTVFGVFFYINAYYDWAILCVSTVGAVAVFFRYNVYGLRNKTFMGDCGSLTIGIIIAVCSIEFLEMNLNPRMVFHSNSAPAVLLGILIVPLLDTLRVFVYRIVHNKSPFSADRNHLHHRLLDLGYKHLPASMIIGGFNAFCILLALVLRNIGTVYLSLVLIACFVIFYATIVYAIRRKQKQESLSNPTNR